MTAVHAGLKRPFAQMQDPELGFPSWSSLNSPDQPGYERDQVSTLDVQRDLAQEQATASFATSGQTQPFEPDSSIVLIGIRGVGKSSLAVITAGAYRRRIVEFESAFQQAAGSSQTAFRKLHGAVSYQARHADVLQHVLTTNANGKIIVCNFTDIEGQGAEILRKYAESHPVVHIRRDCAGIQAYLRQWPRERIKMLLQSSQCLLQQCTNYDFFNLTDASSTGNLPISNSSHEHGSHRSAAGSRFLTLKRVERDFLKMLRNILGDHQRAPSHHSAYPLSEIPVELRSFTYSSRVAIQDILAGAHDLDDIQIGADALELVVDDSEVTIQHAVDDEPIAKAFAILRKSTILPLILTVEYDDLRLLTAKGPESTLLERCLRLGPEFLSLNLKLPDSRLRGLSTLKGNTRLIGVLDLPKRPTDGWSDPQWQTTLERAKALGCSVLRLRMPAESQEDNFAAQTLRQALEPLANGIKIAVYCSGERGRTSWCYNKVLTPVQPSGFGEALAQALSGKAMLTSTALTKALFATFVQESMRFLIYGANTGFSLSPAMHNAAYKVCGMPHNYDTYSSATLDDLMRIAKVPTFGGAAITQPFKRQIVQKLDGMSRHAQVIGAINTMIPLRRMAADGGFPDELDIISQRNMRGTVKALYGDNTDWIGIRACIRKGLSPANTVRPETTGLVCGAGGMARAAIYAMLSLGVQNVFIGNRTLANARGLAKHYNDMLKAGVIAGIQADEATIHTIDSFDSEWPQGFRPPTMIVVSIPAQPADGSAPPNFTIPCNWLNSPTGGVVVELAYRPVITPVVRQISTMADKGYILMDGFDMLPEQAFAQFELFTGRRAPRRVMRQEAMKRYRQEQKSLE
ncbi:quinate utilization gene repressor [Polychaeton citri CBS 116435]|uniref:Quinate utilization gene repressor n=1 Tax=Polychaeton citri CBS 116435 TaxID=1314669 RepID=A0A9P4UUB6_9PEZI|nr:quinate utilization gene repressor [Polychaeton citri CBS 116435]